MSRSLIAIEAHDAEGATCSRRTYELPPGLSEADRHAEIERLVAHAHPDAVACPTDPRGPYAEAGRTVTVRPVVPPQPAAEHDQNRLFAA